MKKESAALGSALPDPVRSADTVSPVPAPVIANKTAPGRRGPRGLFPRTTYSRVNTGPPPVADVGAGVQKSVPPRGMEFLPAKTAQSEEDMMTMAPRPLLQEMLKAAMAGTAGKVEITEQAAHQLAVQTGEEEKNASQESVEHYSTEQISKLASALDFIADGIQKEADQGKTVMPGKGPQALQVMESARKDKNIDAGEGGQATAPHRPPKNPPTQQEEVQTGKANTGLQTNDAMGHPEQPTDPWANEKASLQNAASKQAEALQARNAEKLAQIERFKGKKAPPYQGIAAKGEPPAAMQKKSGVDIGLIRKLAEDAINPASISSKGETPPAATPSEQGVPPVPSDVKSQQKMVRSNEAAINYTKGQAKENPKGDVAKVLNEPPLSAKTDKVLQKTLAHTGEAGVKISSAERMAGDVHRVAAARALLSSMKEKVAATCAGKNKKEKESMMGAAPTTPSSATGVTAATMR